MFRLEASPVSDKEPQKCFVSSCLRTVPFPYGLVFCDNERRRLLVITAINLVVLHSRALVVDQCGADVTGVDKKSGAGKHQNKRQIKSQHTKGWLEKISEEKDV